MTEILLRVAGKPEGKGRPRFGKGHRVFTPKATEVAEREIRQAWREAGEQRLPDDAAIRIDLTLVVCRPQNHFKKNGDLTAEGMRHPVPRNKKPDVDNALKLALDSLNTRAYKDDVQVAQVGINRVWGDWPETVIRLREIP